MSAGRAGDLERSANARATARPGELVVQVIGGQRLAQVGEHHLLADGEAGGDPGHHWPPGPDRDPGDLGLAPGIDGDGGRAAGAVHGRGGHADPAALRRDDGDVGVSAGVQAGGPPGQADRDGVGMGTTTCSPAVSPLVIWVSPSEVSPVVTSFATRWPCTIVYTTIFPPEKTTAAFGTARTLLTWL